MRTYSLLGKKHKLVRPISAAVASLVGSFISTAQAQEIEPTKSVPQQAIEVIGDRALEDTYAPGITTIGKMPLEQRDIPQSTTVIPQQLMRDQGVTNLREALRNVAGLTFNAGEGGRTGDQVTLRGFSATTDLYLDGIRDIGQYNRDTFYTERVEVLKGPGSMLFGRGSTGGVINQVTKLPREKQKREIEFTLGLPKQARATIDINQPITDDLTFRITALGNLDSGFVDDARTRRYGVMPSIKYKFTPNTFVTLSYLHLQDKNIPYFGVPYFQGRPANVPQRNFYGLADVDYENTQTDMGTAIFQHRFNPNMSVTNTTRVARYERDAWPSAPRRNQLSRNTPPLPITDPNAIKRNRPGRSGVDQEFINQTDLLVEAKTGSIGHTILIGTELSRETSSSKRFDSLNPTPSTSLLNPNSRPVLPAQIKKYNSSTDFTANTIGIYAQDMVALTSKLKVLGGLRYDRFSGDYKKTDFQKNTNENFSRTDHIFSWRTGLIYQPSDIQSYYVAYGTSFNPSGEAYALDVSSIKLPPEKNRNIEAGTIWTPKNSDLSLRASIFRITKTHERNTDPLDSKTKLLSGKRHTDGIELEAAGRLTSRWEVFAGTTLMRARIDESLQRNEIGKRPRNTPIYTASLWSSYKLTPNWKIGGGMAAVGNRFSNNTNTNTLRSYLTWDAMIAYEQKNYAVQLNVYNLFNRKYYDGLYGGHAAVGQPLAARLTATYKF